MEGQRSLKKYEYKELDGWKFAMPKTKIVKKILQSGKTGKR